MTTYGNRTHGAVTHIIRHGDTSLCGRYTIPSTSPVQRLCRTCSRIQPTVSITTPTQSHSVSPAFLADAKARKAERDTRLSHTPTAELPILRNTWEYKLTAFELEITIAKVDKINARCAKRSIPGGLIVESHEETITETHNGIEIQYIVYPTRITGIAPVITGWEFIATVDYDPYAGLIIRTYPGIDSVDRTQLREEWCDHCQTSRIRNVMYLVRNMETGEQIQVGSSCIKDFTGWTCLPYTFDNDRKALEESYGSSSHDVTTLTALAISWACVTQHGYVKTSEAGSTRGHVCNVIWPPKYLSDEAERELDFLADYADTMYDRAKELQAWILSDEFTGNGEYVWNLKAVASGTRVTAKNLGILCSAPQAWARHLEKTLIRKIEASPVISEYFGEIGERWSIPLTVESERYIETAFGCSTLYRMTDAKGNVFKWFASNGDLTVGTNVTLSAGIKTHKEWNNVHETGLTRCKVVDDIPEALKTKDAKVNKAFELTDIGELNSKDIYLIDGQYYRLRVTKGIHYAQRHTDDGWQYARGAIKDLQATNKLTAEQAAHFGHTYGACVYCHRPLSDERSTSVGYGHECADKHELPWG